MKMPALRPPLPPRPILAPPALPPPSANFRVLCAAELAGALAPGIAAYEQGCRGLLVAAVQLATTNQRDGM